MIPKLTNTKIMFALLMLILASTPFAHAVVLESGIPGQAEYGPGQLVPGSIAQFINYIYLFVLGTIGIAVFASLIYWGVVWIASGIADRRGEALGKIKDAFTGLAIALGAYIILNTINPDLLTLKDLNIRGVATSTRSSVAPQFAWQTGNKGNCGTMSGGVYAETDVKMCFQNISSLPPCASTIPVCCKFTNSPSSAPNYQIRTNGVCESGWETARYDNCSNATGYMDGIGNNMIKCADGPNMNTNLTCCF